MPDNGFNVGGADQGQPTHFLPRRNRFVFRVQGADGFTEKDELIWTLTTHGKTEKAYASLRPDYVVDDVVKASETGALGAGTSSPEVRGNKPPSVHIEEVKARTVKVGEPLTVVSDVKDDGIPKRAAAIAGAAGGRGSSGSPPIRRSPRRCATPRCRRRRASPSARTSACTCRGSSTAGRWRQGDLRSAADQGVGRHARRRQLAVGAGLGGARRCRPTACCRCR